MSTPWERELESQRKPVYTKVLIPKELSALMKTRPRLLRRIMLTALWTGFTVFVLLAFTDTRAGEIARGIGYLFVLVPLGLLPILRITLLGEFAKEVSWRIAQQTGCSPELQIAIGRLLMRTPWSKHKFQPGSSDRKPRLRNRVTISNGESRTVEFSYDLSMVVIGPEEWRDPPEKKTDKSLLWYVR